ncbi:DUF1758 domain-containing protein [Trichonephila clavipes]|nr:DUF1758 domain-containing protein [Trichonephila clavipes]
MQEKVGNRLVPGPNYMVDALKLPNQAPRGSGESKQNPTKYSVESSRPLVLVWPLCRNIDHARALLISKFEELSTLDKEIANLIDIESLEEGIVTREEYRDKFIIWKIRAERYVESVSNTAIQNLVENQPQNITLPLNSAVSSILTNQPRLPKLTLESFSGKDISSFPSFGLDLNPQHGNSSLNDVDKFSYLKSVITSDAELALRGLTLTSENYAKAMKILENRFGRKERIVDFHMNRLLNLTPVRKSFDVIAIRNLYDQLEINIRGLESLEISPIPIVVSCFR